MAVAYRHPMSQNIPMVGACLHRPMSALARGVQITELSDGSCMNPDPVVVLQESGILMEHYLSPTKLQLLTGCETLDGVRSLEMKVDTSQTTLNNFGLLLPNLTVLKLTGSLVPRMRDLGSSLSQLEVLWMPRCAVEELDGISSMATLRELYLAYNDVSDLSPLSLMEELQVLDLEGNNVDDIEQIDCLALCSKLQHLTLDGNPVCVAPAPNSVQDNYDYRQIVKRTLTNLLTLDDKPLTSIDSGCASPQNVFDADWKFLEELQNDALLIESLKNETETVLTVGRPTTAALEPAASYRPGSALKPSSSCRASTSITQRPASISGGRPSSAWTDTSKPRPFSSDGVEGVEASSELTCGVVICGNPSKALRSRRKTSSDQGDSTSSHQSLHDLSVFKQGGSSKLDLRLRPATKEEEEEQETEEECPIEEKDLSQLMKELHSWKIQHEKRLEKIRESKAPQVFKVDHNEEDDPSELFSDDLDQFENDFTPPYHTTQTDNSYSKTLSDRAVNHFDDKGIDPYQSSYHHKVMLERSNKTESHPSSQSSHSHKIRSDVSNNTGLIHFEKSLDSDTELLKEYKRFKVLDKHKERMQDGDRSSGEGGQLRELRVSRSPGARRIVVPSSTSPGAFTAGVPEPPSHSRQDFSAKDRPKKLRIGPTGLPGSSHSKQPEIREVLSPTGKGGLLASPSSLRPPLPPSSSHHRIRRSLPEMPSLPSRPPPLFKS